jgi:hypothetical protein
MRFTLREMEARARPLCIQHISEIWMKSTDIVVLLLYLYFSYCSHDWCSTTVIWVPFFFGSYLIDVTTDIVVTSTGTQEIGTAEQEMTSDTTPREEGKLQIVRRSIPSWCCTVSDSLTQACIHATPQIPQSLELSSAPAFSDGSCITSSSILNFIFSKP